jgi:hypothetical protein
VDAVDDQRRDPECHAVDGHPDEEVLHAGSVSGAPSRHERFRVGRAAVLQWAP